MHWNSNDFPLNLKFCEVLSGLGRVDEKMEVDDLLSFYDTFFIAKKVSKKARPFPR
jgi:hypothetical protein